MIFSRVGTHALALREQFYRRRDKTQVLPNDNIIIQYDPLCLLFRCVRLLIFLIVSVLNVNITCTFSVIDSIFNFLFPYGSTKTLTFL
jgi:hypothetical protein